MGEPETVREAEERRESEQPSQRRRRPSARGSSRRVRRRLRGLYFSLAALWGFLAGTAAVLIGLSAAERPLPLGARCCTLIVVGAVLALIGGPVAAAGYRAATRRFR